MAVANVTSAEEASGAASPERSLRRDSIAFVGVVGNSVGIQAPTAGVSFIPALMAGVVGASGAIGQSGPLAFLLAVVAMLFVAYAFTIFTRELSSAGSVYAFNGVALGPSFGFVSAWLLIAVYLSYAAATYASNANIIAVLVRSTGSSVPWPWVAVGLWVITLVLTYRSIAVSTTTIFVLEAVSLMIVAVVAVAVLVAGGYHGHSLSAKPFTPNGLGLSTIGLGIVFAFTGFSGFEVGATLGEESRRSRRVVPTALVTALLVSGGIYTFMSWVETVAFPSGKALAASSLPLVTVANGYLGPPMGTIINVAAIISGVGAQLACVNGATRILFALGRDGFGPRWLERTHPRHRSPIGALGAVGVLSLIGFLPLVRATPLDAYFDIATYGADCIIIAYLFTVVGAIVWLVRRRRLQPLRLAVLVVGVGVMGYIIKNTAYPIPPLPFNYDVYAAGATLLAGIVLVAARPELRRRLGLSALFRVPGGAGSPGAVPRRP